MKENKFMKGNQFYLLRTVNGREKKYTPTGLLKKFNEYASWAIKNPLKEQQLFHYQGKVISKDVNKMRPFTLEGFCNYADIVVNTFKNYAKIEITNEMNAKDLKNAADFLTVTARIRQIIDNHQFEGAAAGFLNPNIIASKLGLVNKQEISGNPDRPLGMSKVTMVIKERKINE